MGHLPSVEDVEEDEQGHESEDDDDDDDDSDDGREDEHSGRHLAAMPILSERERKSIPILYAKGQVYVQLACSTRSSRTKVYQGPVQEKFKFSRGRLPLLLNTAHEI